MTRHDPTAYHDKDLQALAYLLPMHSLTAPTMTLSGPKSAATFKKSTAKGHWAILKPIPERQPLCCQQESGFRLQYSYGIQDARYSLLKSESACATYVFQLQGSRHVAGVWLVCSVLWLFTALLTARLLQHVPGPMLLGCLLAAAAAALGCVGSLLQLCPAVAHLAHLVKLAASAACAFNTVVFVLGAHLCVRLLIGGGAAGHAIDKWAVVDGGRAASCIIIQSLVLCVGCGGHGILSYMQRWIHSTALTDNLV